MNFELNEILTIIDKVKSTGLDTFEYQDDDVKLKIRGRKEVMEQGGISMVPLQTLKEEMEEALYVEAPMVGTFYHAPSEDAQPYVQVGDKVTKGQVIGIIEAMKLMNEIPSEVDGIVEEIMADNESVVEYGQPLIRVRKI